MTSTPAQKRAHRKIQQERRVADNGENIPTVLEALCHSILCGGGGNGVLREVSQSANFCPRCGHALVWRRRRTDERRLA